MGDQKLISCSDSNVSQTINSLNYAKGLKGTTRKAAASTATAAQQHGNQRTTASTASTAAQQHGTKPSITLQNQPRKSQEALRARD